MVNKELKLDLGCGQSCKEGFEGVDYVDGENVRHILNLFKFPWPWMNDTVDEIFCSHFIEHIPMVFLSPRGSYLNVPDSIEDKDLFFCFFDECYRILKPEGKMTVICPSATSDRAFQDPTHRRFIVANTFLYLSTTWRTANKLDHYNIKCSFAQECFSMQDPAVAGRTPEVRTRMGEQYRNVILDWVCHLTAKKDMVNKS